MRLIIRRPGTRVIVQVCERRGTKSVQSKAFTVYEATFKDVLRVVLSVIKKGSA